MLWEQIRANRRRSIVLITVMAAVLLAIGYTGAELLVPGGGIFGLIVAFFVWAVMMGMYFFASESILLHGAGARELQREDSPRLFNIVEEMKLASGLTFMPKIYLIDDPAPNAFAIGNKPENSAIAVTSGLMHRLNRDELQGVIAHEIGHLKNRDVQFMTLAAVMLGSIVVLAEIVRRALWYGGRGRGRSSSRGGGQAQAIILVVGLIFAILGPLFAQILYFACSRKREFLADACGAQFTRYPEGLASALEKISQSRNKLSFASKATAPMFIVNPFAASGEARSVFSTHPPTVERIRILRSMAGASLADYEAAFRNAKGGALIGAGSLQTAPKETIRPPSNEGPIESRHTTRELIYRAYGYLSMRCNCGLVISVPQSYERNEIHCIRCGSILPVPTAKEVEALAAAQASLSRGAPPVVGAAAQNLPPMQYARIGRGWESFRCHCGGTVQISPAFAAPQIKCRNCGRMITIV
jgi:heat shock protein HtpX